MASKRHAPVRTVSHIGRLRARIVDSLYRAQLGPSREAEAQTFAPGRPWHNHRSL